MGDECRWEIKKYVCVYKLNVAKWN
jgi:hypothetical protein